MIGACRLGNISDGPTRVDGDEDQKEKDHVVMGPDPTVRFINCFNHDTQRLNHLMGLKN